MLVGDAAVVVRDPCLRGLATALDDDMLASRLAEAWRGRPGQVQSVSVRYLRYKPGTQLLAAIDIDVGKGPVLGLLATTSDAAATKLTKLVRHGARHPGAFQPVGLHEVPLVVAPVEADRRLPGLDQLASRLRRLVPSLFHALLVPMTYKPHRRFVARLDLDGAPRAVVKVHEPGTAHGVVAALRWADHFSGSGLRLPRLLGADPKRGIVVTEWMPGASLDEQEPDRRRATLREVGKLVGRLHGCDPADLPASDDNPSPAILDSIRHVRPDLESMTEDVLSTVPASAATAPVHGDLSPDQVVHGRDGVALIDLDRTARGCPASDLASWLAAGIVAGEPNGTGADDHAGEVGGMAVPESLREGYQGVGGPASEHEVLAMLPLELLRRATDPFRLRRPDWHRRMTKVVNQASWLAREVVP